MPVNKVVGSFDEAVADVPDGASVHIGGFTGSADHPSYLIAALARRGVKDLTIATNLSGFGPDQFALLQERMSTLLRFPKDFFSPGLLISRRQVRKGIFTFPIFPGSQIEAPFERLLKEGEVELELIGQGSLAERIRAARAGIAAFYTPVGVGTAVAHGKEVRWFDGKPHLLEHALKADYAIIRAHWSDRWGNLTFHGTARTFNATMAGAATVTIAEVDDVVELGDLDPEHVVVPAPFVQRVVKRPSEPVAGWETPC
jgi:3-oxoacid CoA-transferase A subunit